MLHGEKTREKMLIAFRQESRQWNRVIGSLENEMRFINALLGSDAFKRATPNLFERLQQFRQESEMQQAEILKIKKEIEAYEAQLNDALGREEPQYGINYEEKHKSQKNRFENFFNAFNDFKINVFNYSAGHL